MDRIRNARHFASRLQRWLDGIGGAVQQPTLREHIKALKVNDKQLDLFAQDFSASPTPVAPPTAPPALPPSAVSDSTLPDSALPAPLAATPPMPLADLPGAALLRPSTPIISPPPVPLAPSHPSPPDPQRGPDAAPLRQLQLGPHRLDYTLRRSTRRSIGFMIDDAGLRVTAPKRITLAEIDNAIRAKQGWILSKLHERSERREQRQQRPAITWIDGAAIPYLGGEIVLRLHQAARHRASFNPQTAELHVWLTPHSTEQQLKERVKAWLQHDARRLFEERLDLYAAQLGVSYASFALSSAGTRWGSCTVQRTIRLNWRLIHFALPLVDYVVAHELAHLREMNHSPRFWAEVASIYPDYEEAKLALRKRAQELPPLFA